MNFTPVLLGSDQNVYGMARSFHEKYNIKSVAIARSILPVMRYSRIVSVAICEPELEDNEVFIKTLVTYAKEHEGTKILIPCGDDYARLLAENKERLRDYYLFSCPDKEIVKELSYKESFYRACEKYGLDYPQTYECSYENYKETKLPFEFPVVVKPSDSVAYWNCRFEHKKKVFIARDEKEFFAILDAIYSSSYKSNLIIQEFVPGDDSAMRVVNCYCGKDKKVRLISLGKVLLEEHTPQGIGSYAAIISGKDKALANKIKEFLEAIGYEGFINIDIKYDSRDGKYKFFETNLRQGRSSFFTTAAGYNLAQFLVDDILLNKKYDTVIADNEWLWVNIPKSVIFNYVSDNRLKEKAKELIDKKRFTNQLYYKPDMGLKRRILFYVNQKNQVKKFRENFQQKGYFD